MSYVQDKRPAGTQPQVNVNETTGAGPLSVPGEQSTLRYSRRRVPMRLRLEKIGFWILVVAALGVILLLVGFLLPTLLGAASTGFFAGLFVSLLTLMNLPRAAGWGNSLLGRRVFPVIQAPDSDIIRLAGVNGVLVAIFTFIYRAIASTFVGPFFGGLIVFVALVAAAVFYNRVRSVVTKP